MLSPIYPLYYFHERRKTVLSSLYFHPNLVAMRTIIGMENFKKVSFGSIRDFGHTLVLVQKEQGPQTADFKAMSGP